MINTTAYSAELIIYLHERGFIHDFTRLGDTILWVQENICLDVSEFKIQEYHGILSPGGGRKGSIILGLLAPRYNIKGILINHFSLKSSSHPSLLLDHSAQLLPSIL